jgi:membrane peptidoglycan carboxypeptidase
MVYTGAERELPRKIRELLYAVEMERTLGKARMLDLYLAMAPWGSGGCGAQAAARTMYGRPLERLQVAELARLAAGLRDDERWRDVGNVVQIVRAQRTITRTERADAIAALCVGSVVPECVTRGLHAAR